jgi:chromosome segregation and condensation protein ScpB
LLRLAKTSHIRKIGDLAKVLDCDCSDKIAAMIVSLRHVLGHDSKELRKCAYAWSLVIEEEHTVMRIENAE